MDLAALTRRYTRGLSDRALKISELAAQEPLPSAQIRRLAHQLRGSAAAYGLPDLSVLAGAAEDAPDGELRGATEALVAGLHAASAESG